MAKGPARLLIIGALLLAILLGACSSGNSADGQGAEGSANETPTLRIYNWDTYIDPQILEDFQARYNVAIDYKVFDSDEDLLAELRSGATDQYDVIVPSDFIVSIMRSEQLLAPLDKEYLPNFSNIDPTFISPVYDPANRFCAPYQWGTVGIGYNEQAVGREITSWADFFDPEFAGRVAMLDDHRTTLGIALINLGYSPNTTNQAEIAEAAEFLKRYSNQIGAFTGDDGQDLLVDGQYDMVVEWSGDIFQVMEEAPNIRYVIPAEGSIIWVDNVCIPAQSPNKEQAELFINYLLEPEVGASLSNYVQYGTPNAAAIPFINEEDLNNPAIYPSDAIRERLFFLVDVDPAAAAIYEQAWQEVSAQYDS